MLYRLLENLNTYSEQNAFCINEKYYTYAVLKKMIFSIQKKIKNEKPETNNYAIAIICNDDIETYASILSVWFSGFAYVPISLKTPIERNLKILKDAGIKNILTSISIDEFSQFDFNIIRSETSSDYTDDLKVPSFNQHNYAYILFTSGSTGVPKGVPISFKNLESFIESYDALDIQIESDDKCLQMFELTFDVSIVSFLMPLLNGACVYTIPQDVIKYLYIVKLLKEYNLTNITIVPSIITLLKPYLKQLKFENVRHCILTAEATYIDLLISLKNVLPNARIWNLYGPTEATIWCTYLEYNSDISKEYNGMLAIGKPFKNVKAIIADETDNIVKAFDKGELCISGNQITTGYLNNSEKNNIAFFEKDINGELIRFYKTGDLCYIDLENDIYYCGRLDNQVQIQGFRVELSEIEILVRENYNVNNIVIPRNNKVGTLELILTLERYLNNTDEIKNYLKGKLPYYMIPDKIISIDEFPLNSSGKIDKVKLKSLI